MLDLEAYLHREVPLSRAIGIRVARNDERELVLAAPLAGNTTDKGTAFSGAMLSVLALTGYALTLELALAEDAEVVISHTDADFRLPVEHDFESVLVRPAPRETQAFREHLARSGRARWTLAPCIRTPAGEVAVRFTGTYVARRGGAR